MHYKNITRNSYKENTFNIAMSTIVALIITVIICAFETWLILAGKLNIENVKYSIPIIILLSTFIGSMYSKLGNNKLYFIIISNILYLILLLLINAILYNGVFKGIGVTAVVALGGGVLAILIKANPHRGGKGKFN